MFARLALASDEDAVVAMIIADLAETCPGEPYDEAKLREGFHAYLATANPTIFVAEERRLAIGVLISRIVDFDYRAGFYVTQRLLYVSPENRGTRASVHLVRELIRWSQLIGAVRIDGGNDNDFQSDRTAAFLSHFGFRKVGNVMTLRLDGAGGQERRRE